MRDYTKRVSQKADKLSKEQLLTLLDNMADENESLYSLFDSLADGVIIVDNKFRLLKHNISVESRIPFYEHLKEIKNQTNPIWEFIADESIAKYFKSCAEKENTNSSEDFSIVTPGGTVRFISITLSPIFSKGELNGRVIFVNDITEKKNQEIRMHRMENLASLTNLAASMAHDIKNPLGAISIHIQLVQKALEKARANEDILPPKKFVEDHIDIVNEEIDHLNKLVMDFLLAVRPVKATLQLKDPNDIISNIVDFVTPEFNREDVEVVFKPSATAQRIMLDEKLFKDVVLNLSQNALAAIKSHKKNDESVQGIFEIDCKISDNSYIITIMDNGCGMDKETAQKIFEPYFTTKASGTGLGMTMVYKVIKEFSGNILVDSVENKGTKFTINFPIPQKDIKLLSNNKNN